ncbi:hypothetical protein WNZ14_08660 [Hoeflea sp. AS60]|uniref:hypothetical protein n=1 Tax=Hoeflea sp. AS60 TaxID=3135780 RepID=UPI00317E0512
MNVEEDVSRNPVAPMHFSFIGSPDLATQPQIQWALSELQKRLGERNTRFDQIGAVAAGDLDGTIFVFALGPGAEIAEISKNCGVDLPLTPESFAIFREIRGPQKILFAYGADIRGVIYAITELADRVRFMPSVSQAFRFDTPMVESPTAKVRSISKCFQSEIEDLPWFHDRDGWEEYLTHLVTHRFNRISLTLGMQYNYPYGNEFVSDVYFHLAYPFLVTVPGFDVTISNLTDEERRRNLDSLKFIAREAVRRGLEFQLALWTQSYDFDDCPKAKHQIGGITEANRSGYCRDALAIILAEVPEISGLTLRIHVECGIPEGDYAFWQDYFEAVKGAGRPLRLDLHAKGLDEKLIEIAFSTGMPVAVSPKYTSEHMGLPYHQASIRDLEIPANDTPSDGTVQGRDLTTLYSGPDAESHIGKWKFSEGSRKFMRYSYGDLLHQDRSYDIIFRIWPGTTRVLLWGDPAIAGGYGRNSVFCGSLGVELCEPLSFKGRMGTGTSGGRTGYQDKWRVHDRDWKKFEYTYRVWGRSLYNPDAEREAFSRFLEAKFGEAAAHCGRAISSASRILPLITLAHTPTASNNSYWPEMYENMSIVHEAPYLPYGYELAKPARFGTVGSCDPQMFMSPSEFAGCLHDHGEIRKYSPLTWANWLEQFAASAAVEMAHARSLSDNPGPELHLISVDVTILAAIGRFFADKMRAAVLWEYFLLSGETRSAREAVRHYRLARDAWAEAAEICQDVYLPDLTYGPHSWLRGRWDDRLPAIEQDVADMEALVKEAPRIPSDSTSVGELSVELILSWSATQLHPCRHSPPDSFVRGEAIVLACIPLGASRRAINLHYRHVNQSEEWQVAEMTWRNGEYLGEIPKEYTDSHYSIMYYFEITENRISYYFPGIIDDLSNTPYFVISTEK